MTLRIHWGIGIALVYAAFAAGTAAFVLFATRQPVELVSADYYERSLTHDERLAATARAAAVAGDYQIDGAADGRRVDLRFGAAAPIDGAVALYRPADAASDRVFRIALDATGRQSIALDTLAPGSWVIQVSWSQNGQTFYLERRLVLR